MADNVTLHPTSALERKKFFGRSPRSCCSSFGRSKESMNQHAKESKRNHVDELIKILDEVFGE